MLSVAKLLQQREVLLLEPLNVSGNFGADAPQFVAGGDVECFQIFVAERTVGDHVGWNRDELNELAFWSDDVDSGLVFIGGLSWRFRIIESGRYVEAAFRIDRHSVRATVASPVE